MIKYIIDLIIISGGLMMMTTMLILSYDEIKGRIQQAKKDAEYIYEPDFPVKIPVEDDLV